MATDKERLDWLNKNLHQDACAVRLGYKAKDTGDGMPCYCSTWVQDGQDIRDAIDSIIAAQRKNKRDGVLRCD